MLDSDNMVTVALFLVANTVTVKPVLHVLLRLKIASAALAALPAQIA